MRILITGAAGFIGSHIVEHFLKTEENLELILIDKLSYAANGMSRLKDIKAFEQSRNKVHMFPIDISFPISIGTEKEIGKVDYILHLAAETHVDNSILDPRSFVQANVVGTMEMLQFARKCAPRLKAFFYFSTDEVFGPAPVGQFYQEWARYNATNPYSATKAAGEELCLAFANTYGVPLVVTHCMNAFGERQHPEKYIPLCVKKILNGDTISIHTDQFHVPGSRSYIHCRNIASAIGFLMKNMEKISLRDKFNISGEIEIDNLLLAATIHECMQTIMEIKLPFQYQLVDYHAGRPGHDLRYALNGEKMEKLGWKPPKTFHDSLFQTIKWMISHRNISWLLIP